MIKMLLEFCNYDARQIVKAIADIVGVALITAISLYIMALSMLLIGG
jgi:hypothetical protein